MISLEEILSFVLIDELNDENLLLIKRVNNYIIKNNECFNVIKSLFIIRDKIFEKI
ncbi:hypothetical protein [Thomasclavelia sp.]|uniref:hypothetical protein n=1 Tax=Thomasclavelia sp. TaxID=3025757 RepID=UPI0025ECCA50|nr:hypothetical protein [Thomasclavelia sp.]